MTKKKTFVVVPQYQLPFDSDSRGYNAQVDRLKRKMETVNKGFGVKLYLTNDGEPLAVVGNGTARIKIEGE